MSAPTRPEDDRRRERLYDVFDAENTPLAVKKRRALAIGREYLGVENGHIQRIVEDGETHLVTESVGDEDLLPAGMELDQSKTYCRRTIQQNTPLALSDVIAQGYADDPAYENTGAACYLGTPIFVDGETYGTICFVSEDPRTEAFGSGERAFVELVARLLGREIEGSRREQELEQRERTLDSRSDALEQSEQKYESLLTTAPEAILLFDADTATVAEANEAAAALTGYERDVLVGWSCADLVPARQRDQYRSAFENLGCEQEVQSRFDDGTQLYFERDDGTEVPVEISSNSVTLGGREYIHSIVRDISDRREREAELRVRNRAIETASIGITIADATDPELPLVDANDAFEELTGYETTDVLGENCRFLQGPDTDPETVGEIRAALAAREPIRRELLNYRADGTPFWNELSLTPVTDQGGDVTHFVGFQRDVTERKRRERLITVLNRVLRHNLRNKTNVVAGQAGILADRLDGDHQELTDGIRHAAAQLSDLSEKAHTLESAVHGDRTPSVRDVRPVVEERVEAARQEYGGADIRLDAPAGAQAVIPEKLAAALRELLENAVKHSEPVTETPTVTVSVEPGSDGGVSIHVTDDGPGLPENERTALDRGYETYLEHGSGLGLPLVTWVVTGVGGWVATSVDDGTTVSIHLPGA